MNSNKWVPFTEAHEATEGRITVGYTGLPNPLASEGLLLNVNALKSSVINWGGYNNMVLASYSGEKDSVSIGGSPDNNGVGTASASMSISKAESSDSDSLSDKQLQVIDVRNGSLGVKWNINALNSRLQIHEQYDAKIRAKQLDKIVRSEAIKAVYRHNTVDTINSMPILGTLLTTFDALFVSTLGIELASQQYGDFAESLSYRVVFFNSINMLSRYFGTKQGRNFKDYIKDPLFLGTRLTRATLGAGILATSQLVKPA